MSSYKKEYSKALKKFLAAIFGLIFLIIIIITQAPEEYRDNLACIVFLGIVVLFIGAPIKHGRKMRRLEANLEKEFQEGTITEEEYSQEIDAKQSLKSKIGKWCLVIAIIRIIVYFFHK